MGTFAEDCAGTYKFSREAQDKYALRSLARAQEAIANGSFAGEITPVTVKSRKSDQVGETDEQPGAARPDKIPQLKPAFRAGGTVTAANSSSISDGAAALVMMRLSEAEARGLTPLAKIAGHATHAQAPALFTTAPVGAMQKLSDKTGWHLKDVDLFEINEAFAVVPMAAMHDLDLPADKVNIHGGACALGHPIGASGARIMVTLLAAMAQNDLRRGMASLCIGGGEATAIALERLT
jgi:acetyl-CoA C-acetyltransferase